MEAPNPRLSKILLVDAHSSFRQGLAFVLNDDPDLEVIAQAGTPNETHEVLDRCDLVIIKPVLPDGDGLVNASGLKTPCFRQAPVYARGSGFVICF